MGRCHSNHARDGRWGEPCMDTQFGSNARGCPTRCAAPLARRSDPRCRARSPRPQNRAILRRLKRPMQKPPAIPANSKIKQVERSRRSCVRWLGSLTGPAFGRSAAWLTTACMLGSSESWSPQQQPRLGALAPVEEPSTASRADIASVFVVKLMSPRSQRPPQIDRG